MYYEVSIRTDSGFPCGNYNPFVRFGIRAWERPWSSGRAVGGFSRIGHHLAGQLGVLVALTSIWPKAWHSGWAVALPNALVTVGGLVPCGCFGLTQRARRVVPRFVVSRTLLAALAGRTGVREGGSQPRPSMDWGLRFSRLLRAALTGCFAGRVPSQHLVSGGTLFPGSV